MSATRSLDVIVPTYNRAHLIAGCLQSLIEARRPSNLTIQIFVVDNNSSDDTARIVRDIAKRHPQLVTYVFEKRQGRSAALNGGIRAGAGTLIGMIDDDERVDPEWFEVIVDCFRDPDLDFIGGPYVPIWCGARRPEWMPAHWQGVLGIDEDIPATCVPFTRDMRLCLKGGNAVVRRSVFATVGLYSTDLGRSANGLASCEDHDMLLRLLDAGARGVWVPRLIINHLIIPERLTKRYFRRWAFDHAVSLARMRCEVRRSHPEVYDRHHCSHDHALLPRKEQGRRLFGGAGMLGPRRTRVRGVPLRHETCAALSVHPWNALATA